MRVLDHKVEIEGGDTLGRRDGNARPHAGAQYAARSTVKALRDGTTETVDSGNARGGLGRDARQATLGRLAAEGSH